MLAVKQRYWRCDNYSSHEWDIDDNRRAAEVVRLLFIGNVDRGRYIRRDEAWLVIACPRVRLS